MRLQGKTALVTGAASGFGAGIAELYTNEGANVVAADMNSDGAREIAARLGECAVPAPCDVTDRAAVSAAIETGINAFGGIDIVVNNAGFSHVNQPMESVDEETFDRVFDVNVKAIYLTTLEILPHFRERGAGCIVNIGSTAGIRPRPGLTWYNASKGAVNLLSKSMAVELAPDNIRVNCIAPVAGETGLLATFMGGADTPEKRAKFISTIPMGRLSTPSDIARVALFLVSEDAAFVTGAVLEVDGGRCI